MYFYQIVEQSLLMFPLVLGIYLSFSVLKIADLTVDGSFVLGASVYARLHMSGLSFFWSIMGAIGVGLCAGIVVGLVQRKNRVDPLIAGILTAFILHSLSLIIMQRPNVGLLTSNSFFATDGAMRFYCLVAIAVFLTIFFSTFLSGKMGLWMKAFGNNSQLVSMLGVNPEYLRLGGLALSNACVAFAGAITAQANGYADINMGLGQALIGIAIVLIGRQLLQLIKRHQTRNDALQLIFIFFGVLFYFGLTNEIIRHGLNPMYLKMAIGILLIVFLSMVANNSSRSKGIMS